MFLRECEGWVQINQIQHKRDAAVHRLRYQIGLTTICRRPLLYWQQDRQVHEIALVRRQVTFSFVTLR